MKNVRLLIVDELSMLSAVVLAKMHMRLMVSECFASFP